MTIKGPTLVFRKKTWIGDKGFCAVVADNAIEVIGESVGELTQNQKQEIREPMADFLCGCYYLFEREREWEQVDIYAEELGSCIGRAILGEKNAFAPVFIEQPYHEIYRAIREFWPTLQPEVTK